MGSKHPQHVNVILERQGVEPDITYAVAARGLASLDAAQKKAKQFASEKPGTIYIPGRFYPGVMAQVKTAVKFVDPDEREPQQPDGAGMKANGN